MIKQQHCIKPENPVTHGGATTYCDLGRRASTAAAQSGGPVAVDNMHVKLDERLNELESNAVRALLSLGEAIVSQSPYRAPIPVKKQPDPPVSVRPLQLQQVNAPQHPPRSVIVKAEPASSQQAPQQVPQNGQILSCPSSVIREVGSSSANGLNTVNNQQPTITFTPVTTSAPPVAPPPPINSNNLTSPVSIQQIASTSSPVISTIFYQIPVTAAAGGTTNGTNRGGTTVMSPPSFTIIPAPNGRAVIPLPMVTGNATPLVKIEPGTGTPAGVKNASQLNWNNIQLVKVPRTSVENGNFSALAPVAPLPKEVKTPTKLLPSPSKGDGKSSFTPSTATTANGKTPTKSRARRRSQNTPKGQSRNSRVSSGSSSDSVVSSSVEGLPNIVVDGYEISRETWAKAFLQNDIIHAAGTLFNALFSSDEIKHCTLNGRNGTRQLCPDKRLAIFKIVAWMKNKCQDPYSFDKSAEETKILSRDELQMIEKKVFVERRYQTSRKIRDLPNAPLQSTSPSSSSVVTSTSTTSVKPSISPSISPRPSNKNSVNSSNKVTSIPLKKCVNVIAAPASSTSPPDHIHPQKRRNSSGSFSSICSSSGDDKGIPKIALIQSSEIIANYFQNAEPLPIPPNPMATPLIHLSNHKHDGPPPMKMQKVG